MLATAVDSTRWTTAMLDEALRNALQEFCERGPTVEVTFIAINGYEQNIGDDVPDLYSIERLAWPYETDRTDPTDWAVSFRMKEHGIAILETHDEPTAGELIQVIYRRLWTIQNLDSAAATSVNDVHARVVTTLGAYYACLLRLRQLSENSVLIMTQDDEVTIATSGDRTTTVSSGDRTTTVTSGDRTTTVSSGDRTTTVTTGDTVVTTSANSNQFPPIPVQTVTTDHPTVTTVDDVPTVTTVDDVPTVTTVEDVPTITTVEDVPTVETSRTLAHEQYQDITVMTKALEKAIGYFRDLADQRLAGIRHNQGSFVNPSWSRIGL
jgi:hypothetical protein